MSQEPLKQRHPPIPKFSLNTLKPKLESYSSQKMEEIPKILLWVKEEPFLFGVLSPLPCSKLGLVMLTKVAEYCRSRSGSQRHSFVPNLSFEGWTHISKYKLQLPVELSWALVRSFILLTDDGWKTGCSRKNWDDKFEEIRLRGEDPDRELNLDTVQFLLFLYLQNYSRLQNKYQNKAQSWDEHWPGGRDTYGVSPPTTATSSFSSNSTRARKMIAEHGHSTFVEGYLEEILEFLGQVYKKETGTGTSGGGARIPVQVVTALSLILGVASLKGKPKDTEFTSVGVAISAIPGVARAVDFRKEGGTVDKNRFILWVKKHLKLNPWGPSSAAVPQHGVKHLSGVWSPMNAPETNRVFWNTQLYPKGWVLISTIASQVLYLPEVKPFSSLKLHRCSASYIYVPGCFSSILVEKCDNCTLFLGPAGKYVKFVDCSNLRVSAMGRFFIFQDVGHSTFNIGTPCHPLICGSKGRKKVVLGPYNSFYPQLEGDMEAVGLGSRIQKFNRPLELGGDGLPVNLSQPGDGVGVHPAFGTMRSEAFGRFVFPFVMEGVTVKNPVQLPRNYARSLHTLEGVGVAFKNEVAKLSETKKMELNAILQVRFYDWLKKNGGLDQVLGLRALGRRQGCGNGTGLETRKAIRDEIKRLGSRRRSSVGDASSGRKSGELDGEMNRRSLRLAKSSMFFLHGSESDPFEEEESITDAQQKKDPKSGKVRSMDKLFLDQGLLWSPIF